MARLVFISYRRQKGYALAHLVNAELRSRGLRTFLDVAESDPGLFWTQAQTAIHQCRAFVLVCTNGSFDARPGDDWVLREVSEAMALGKPIVPVLSQDFQPPADLHPVLVQAIEHTGVSMDTQFHTAAFDHLSQLVGGRKRSEQRKRVTILSSLAFLVLVGLLGIGAREILKLSAEFHRERDARQAAIARSEELEKNLAVLETSRAEAMRGAQDTERRLKDEADRREREARSEAENRDREAKDQAERRRYACNNRCESTLRECETTCFFKFDGPPRETCKQSCKQYEPFCKSNCQ